ncbi:MAG: LysR family transcriptional regulator [Lachnospiraceae bacterium]|jgi:DNA-binding transcriptional LysR family regulator|nr:LysR family transcriptional regulator [Lachnospiraceae bacterium]
MNFEHYKNFVAIVDAGTISAASKELLIAQPALSNQIKSLEEVYGAQLVIRKPRHIELTDAGKILYDKIKSICYLEDSAKKEIEACVVGNRGTLWLGCSPANPDPILYPLLLDFHATFPDVSFQLFECNSDYIVELLQSGMIDVGLIRMQPHLLPPAIRPVMMIQELYMAYYHREHQTLSPLMGQIPLRCLNGLPVSISHGLKKPFSAACEKEGFTPRYMNISSSRSTSMLWAADKETVSIVVGASSFDDGEYCCRQIAAEDLLSQRMFAVNRSRRLSSVAKGFLQFVRTHVLMERWIHGLTDAGALEE